MFFFAPFLLLGFGLGPTLAHPAPFPHPNTNTSAPHPISLPSRGCGTGPPSPHLLATHQKFHAASASSSRRGLLTRKSTPKITVATYFHVVESTASAGTVTPAMVAAQFAELTAAYAPAGIAFALRNTTWSTNDTWATDAADADMKAALRQGDYSSLNLYFQTNLSAANPGSGAATAGSTIASAPAEQLLGYCSLPANVTYAPCATCARVEFPEADYSEDGCNVLAGSMPGGSVVGYAEGKTAVHEVGHWFGLLHVFQDQTCAAGDAGDWIVDTPQQSTATGGCPVGKSSCGGVDAVWSFMDYSSDACLTNFTSDQMARMQNMWQEMRYGE